MEFARALSRFEERVVAAASRRAATGFTAFDKSYWFALPAFGLQWGLAGAALLLLCATTYFFVQNQSLRRQGGEAREQQAALQRRSQELERQLGEQRSANEGLTKELDRLHEAPAQPHALKIVAALLLPETRGIGQVAIVSVPAGTDEVHLRLQLEADDFPTYRIALKDPVLNQVIWSSATLKAQSEAKAKVISTKVPAGLLKEQNYIAEVTGGANRGTQELLSSYFFKVVK